MLQYERKEGNWTKEHIFGLIVIAFLGLFLAILGLGQKCLIFKNQISHIDLITLKTNFDGPHYIFMLHMTQILKLY